MGVLLATLAVAGAIYLYILPSYTATWEQPVRIMQKSEEGRTFIEYSSFDYLKGIVANIDWTFETIDLRANRMEQDYPLELDWINEEITFETDESDTERILDLEFMLTFAKQPYTVALELEGDWMIEVVECDAVYTQDGESGKVRIEWFSFPPPELNLQLKLRIPVGTELEGELTASFLETPIDIVCTGSSKWFLYGSEIVKALDLDALNQALK
jgi:hypothetical protein